MVPPNRKTEPWVSERLLSHLQGLVFIYLRLLRGICRHGATIKGSHRQQSSSPHPRQERQPCLRHNPYKTADVCLLIGADSCRDTENCARGKHVAQDNERFYSSIRYVRVFLWRWMSNETVNSR